MINASSFAQYNMIISDIILYGQVNNHKIIPNNNYNT